MGDTKKIVKTSKEFVSQIGDCDGSQNKLDTYFMKLKRLKNWTRYLLVR